MWLRILEYLSGARRRLVRLRRIFARRSIPPKILVVRNDGLGDFILTLPMVSALRAALPHAQIAVLAARPLHSLSPLLPEIDLWILDPGCLLKRHRRKKKSEQLAGEYNNLVREIAAHRFDLAIFCYAEQHSAKLIQDAGIPYRLGPLRRPFFYRFNLWYYIPRRHSPQAEYQLNLKILRVLRIDATLRHPQVRFPPMSSPRRRKKYVVLHPIKRSGTALAWPVENFRTLVAELVKRRIQVIAIGDTEDEPLLKEHFAGSAEIVCSQNLLQIAALLQNAQHFFGNSSGPLHLAALVGTPHTGFYPQNHSASPRRWRTLPLPGAPRLQDYLLATNFPVDCTECRLQRCTFYPCTAKIEIASALRSMEIWRQQLRMHKTRKGL